MLEEDLKEFAEWAQCPYVLTSAYQNKGIEEAFVKIVEQIKFESPQPQPSGSDSPTKQKGPSEPKGEKLAASKQTDKKDSKDCKC